MSRERERESWWQTKDFDSVQSKWSWDWLFDGEVGRVGKCLRMNIRFEGFGCWTRLFIKIEPSIRRRKSYESLVRGSSNERSKGRSASQSATKAVRRSRKPQVHQSELSSANQPFVSLGKTHRVLVSISLDHIHSTQSDRHDQLIKQTNKMIYVFTSSSVSVLNQRFRYRSICLIDIRWPINLLTRWIKIENHRFAPFIWHDDVPNMIKFTRATRSLHSSRYDFS